MLTGVRSAPTVAPVSAQIARSSFHTGGSPNGIVVGDAHRVDGVKRQHTDRGHAGGCRPIALMMASNGSTPIRSPGMSWRQTCVAFGPFAVEAG